MKYQNLKPSIELAPYIHSFWELKGEVNDGQWERTYPDGCSGLVINLGDTCRTDNGLVSMDYGKTYAVGAMTSFKDSFIDANTHLVGVCLKPAAFSVFYKYAPQCELTNSTIALDPRQSFSFEKISKSPLNYLNRFFIDRTKINHQPLQSVIEDIHKSNGQLSIYEISKRNNTTVRQLERNFKTHIGITPKEYSNIVRFQNAMSIIRNSDQERSLLDIAFECGYYDHSHLTNEIKRNTGLAPSQL
ncbi:helix-turN-helix, arac domain [Sporocytophaga myxococcoides]|uniref:Helix-turN-helix, arac domain n=1 Tax=Sporocytophaga myxococcoides TaxID=153721 RepID=A0A098LKR1_9BACT|nr:helix-turn-helix transcriptional regulator [Sporocytophaga myxococcoides]GAL87084.1 helix-turN-helix, arac domain [Sporocytophaga myxococcoides]